MTEAISEFIYVRNAEGNFVCPTCGEVKKRQNTMFYHMKKHVGESRYTCTECDKQFLQKSSLDQHMLHIHSSAEKAPTALCCPCCDHETKTKANLLIHVGRKHGTGWIPEPRKAAAAADVFVCGKCEKTLTSTTAYYYHATGCYTAPSELGLDGLLPKH